MRAGPGEGSANSCRGLLFPFVFVLAANFRGGHSAAL